MFILYYFLICFSLVGYGLLFSKILRLDFQNYGFLGLLGITFSITISYLTSVFLTHNYIFNLIYLLSGFVSFLFFYKKKFNYKKNILLTFVIFLILLIFVFVAKNHDDFGYYHFPYSYLLTQMDHLIIMVLLINDFK